ncbi:MAG: DUF3108 domain-containing protein [Alistipes sp.]|nr:DUF3108 domain-containing protein [Alistipes sp.]
MRGIIHIIITGVAALFLCGVAHGQLFHPSERLNYRVAYRAKLFPNTELATVSVTTEVDTLAGRECYRVTGDGQIMKAFRWFFHLHDRYDIWVDSGSKRTLRFESNLQEGDYTFRSHYLYDWDSLKVHTWAQRRSEPPRTKTMSLSPRSMDPMSLYFNLRSIDPAQLREGEEHDLEMVLEDTIRTLKFRLVGRTVCKVPKRGWFNTLHLKCTIGTSEEFSFTDGSEFSIWITDDRNKFPVMLESPIRVGSIRAYIHSFEGLKYPLECQVERPTKRNKEE